MEARTFALIRYGEDGLAQFSVLASRRAWRASGCRGVVALLSKYDIQTLNGQRFKGTGGIRNFCPTLRLFLLGMTSRFASKIRSMRDESP